MTLLKLDPNETLRNILLFTFCDRIDRLTIRINQQSHIYEMIGRSAEGDCEYVCIHSTYYFDFIKAMAASCGIRHRIWSWLTRWARRRWNGVETGNYRFPFGGDTAEIAYNVQWKNCEIEKIVLDIKSSTINSLAAFFAFNQFNKYLGD